MLTCGLALGASSGQAAQRYPVIACFNFAAHAYWPAYKPHFPTFGRRVCSFGPAGGGYGGDVGLLRTRWKGWGSQIARGHGNFYDGLGYPHPATIRLYGLRHVCGLNGLVYTKVHVAWQPIVGGGVVRNGGTHLFHVPPNGQCVNPEVPRQTT